VGFLGTGEIRFYNETIKKNLKAGGWREKGKPGCWDIRQLYMLAVKLDVISAFYFSNIPH